MKQLLGFALILLLISSCVVNKKYQYLQNDDVNVKGDIIEKDSVLRTYDLSDFEYRLQPEDIRGRREVQLRPEVPAAVTTELSPRSSSLTMSYSFLLITNLLNVEHFVCCSVVI